MSIVQEAAPVDLAQHAKEFRARLEAEQSPLAAFALDDGITRDEARLLALVFNPECRLARTRAGVAVAGSKYAGRWADPALTVDFERILESVQHPWLVGGAIELTLPLFGQRGLEQDLADAELDLALLEARLAEHRVLLDLERAWAEWSAARLRRDAAAEALDRIAELAAVVTRLAAADELNATQARVFTLERLARADEVAVAESEATIAQLKLAAVLGLPPTAPFELVPAIDGSLRAPAHERDDHLRRGPRVAIARHAHLVSERALELEVRKQWPELTLAPGFAEEDAQPRFTLGLSLPLALWNGNVQAIAKATAQREHRAEALRSEYERALQSLAIAQQAHRAATERRARITDELLPVAEQQLADSRTLADRGILDPLLLLDSLTRLHAARLEVIDATLTEALARSEIEALFWTDATTTAPAAEEER